METMETILGKGLSFKNEKVHFKFKKKKKEIQKTVAVEASAVTIT